jgi:calcium/calmodulin-dependent protein kinase I
LADQQLDVEKKYKIGKLLGTGNFAEVKLGTDKKTGAKYAIKIIDKSLCAGKEDMIEMELTVLKQAQHRW